MLEFKEGQTYVCTKSTEEYWTEGKEYTVVLTCYGIPALTDNNGNTWSATALNLDNHQFELKENTRMRIVTSYKCIKSNDERRFTVGEIYPLYKGVIDYILSNNNVKWYENEYDILKKEYGVEFDEVKETFDLNKLTTPQLKEYVELLEDKENSERLLNEFIERMTK